MNTVVGSGCAGLLAGARFAETGNRVICADTNVARIDFLRPDRVIVDTDCDEARDVVRRLVKITPTFVRVATRDRLGGFLSGPSASVNLCKSRHQEESS